MDETENIWKMLKLPPVIKRSKNSVLLIIWALIKEPNRNVLLKCRVMNDLHGGHIRSCLSRFTL